MEVLTNMRPDVTNVGSDHYFETLFFCPNIGEMTAKPNLPKLKIVTRLSQTSNGPLCRECIGNMETPDDIFETYSELIKKPIKTWEDKSGAHTHDSSELIQG